MLSRVERGVCQYFLQQEFLATGHSRLMGHYFLLMLSPLPGLGNEMIIALCHISGFCPVEIDNLKM